MCCRWKQRSHTYIITIMIKQHFALFLFSLLLQLLLESERQVI
jgi:hypothetical protein